MIRFIRMHGTLPLTGGRRMAHPVSIVVVDSRTAATLAQVMPLLLLTLAVELRRTQRHRTVRRWRIGLFLAVFGLVEVVLVLSIDGSFYPFQWFDILSTVMILWLMSLIFRLSLSEPPKDNGDNDAD
jgi:hypothetical protein